jgi:hypothetical protein
MNFKGNRHFKVEAFGRDRKIVQWNSAKKMVKNCNGLY